jgi:hypothetical protein
MQKHQKKIENKRILRFGLWGLAAVEVFIFCLSLVISLRLEKHNIDFFPALLMIWKDTGFIMLLGIIIYILAFIIRGFERSSYAIDITDLTDSEVEFYYAKLGSEIKSRSKESLLQEIEVDHD